MDLHEVILINEHNELETSDSTQTTAIGTLANLTTTEKGSLVGAINEIVSDLLSFTTVNGSGTGNDTYAIDLGLRPVKNIKISITDTDAKTITVSNVPTDCSLFIILTYTSAATITWFNGINWLYGSPTFIEGKVYEIGLTTSNSGTNWRGIVTGGW